MNAPSLVHETDAVVAVDKPHGWLTIPGRLGAADPRPVLSRFLGDRYGSKVWIVHRLDREVSGLVLFARTAEAHRLLCGWFERHRVGKWYEAWTEGSLPEAPEAEWEGWLIRGKRRVHASPGAGKGKWSRTLARCEGEDARADLRFLRWTLLPETGRSHQLRCQAAGRGFPILGDALYGSKTAFRDGAIALRAVGLGFQGIAAEERSALGLPEGLRVEGLG